MRKHLIGNLILLAAVTAVGASASAKTPPRSTSSVQVQKLLSCRSQTSAEQRLACFDREAQAMEGAIARKDLMFVDREKATATKRALFGFAIPNFGGLFGDDDGQVNQIEGVVEAVRRSPDGGLTVQLADKSVWRQTDDAMLGVAPRKGDKVTVKQGTMGSFWLQVIGRQGFKVRRVG